MQIGEKDKEKIRIVGQKNGREWQELRGRRKLKRMNKTERK